MLDNKLIGQMIKSMRKSRNFTQEQLGEQLHVTKKNISAWELGKYSPDKDLMEVLTKKYGMDFSDTNIIREGSTSMNIKPLEEIKSFEEFQASINAILKAVELDQGTEKTVRKLLHMALTFTVGYVAYYQKNFVDEAESDWGSVAWELTNLVDEEEYYPISKEAVYEYCKERDIVAAKVLYACRNHIGAELFEDFDMPERPDRVLGRYAEECGYDLIKLLPKTDNSIMTSFKVGLFMVSDVLNEIA